ncbi:hypothetical protein SRHO_G00030850 [Serrasalmus rhombeus]
MSEGKFVEQLLIICSLADKTCKCSKLGRGGGGRGLVTSLRRSESKAGLFDELRDLQTFSEEQRAAGKLAASERLSLLCRIACWTVGSGKRRCLDAGTASPRRKTVQNRREKPARCACAAAVLGSSSESLQ